jgi:glycerol-3-phosphate dehydrogenase
MIPKTSDGRVLFAVPWHDHLVVGTTDTPINTNSAEPVALEEEIRFILDTASAYLSRKVERSDVLSVFAGLRPLAAPKDDSSKTKEISRNHKIIVSKSKLITIIGGKWTTYRKMAEDMIDTAIKAGLLPPAVSTTKNYPVLESFSPGGPFHIYGQNGKEIAAIAEQDPKKKTLIHPDLPYSWAEVEWCCRNEMVMHLEDLLARRLRALLLNARASSEIAEEVANRSVSWLGWTPEQAAAETVSFRELAENYIL